MAENKFSKEVQALVNYVKDNMKNENDWVVIRYRDVPEITGASSYYVRKLFELLKAHPNIIFEVDKDAKTNKKPLKFRYTSKSEKINRTITGKQFHYLSDEDVNYIKNTVKIDDYELLFDLVNVCNYFVSIKANEEPVMLDKKVIANIFLFKKEELEKIVNILFESEILVDVGRGVRLLLNQKDLQSVKSSLNQSHTLSDVKHLDVARLVDKILEKQGLDLDTKEDQAEEIELDESKSLIENMKYFHKTITSIQQDFQSFLDDQINRLSEAEKNQEEMEQGYETLQKLMGENSRLKDENEKLTHENNRLLRSLEASQKFREEFIAFSQQRFEILLADIIGVVTNFSRLPGWKKDQAASAKLQRNILDAVTATIDDMLKFTKE